MAEEIILGKLIIDTSDLEGAMADSKKAIVDLTAEQKKLQKETDGLSTANEDQLKTFVANEAELKRLKAEYSANQKSVLDLTKAQTGLDDALKAQVKSQNDAIQNTKDLTAARKQIDATTVDGAKAIVDINAKIDENNKFLNASNSELEKQKANVGNYPQLMAGVGGAFGDATKKAIGFVQGGKDAIAGLGEVGNAVVNTARSVVGFGNASKAAALQTQALTVVNTEAAVATEGLAVAEETATVATTELAVAEGILLAPIILIVAAIVALIAGFYAIKTAMDRNAEAGAKIQKVFSAFSGILNMLLDVLAKVGEFLIDKIAAGFDFVGNAAEEAMSLISSGLSALGFDDAAKSVKGFTENVKSSVKAAQALADAEKELEKAQRTSRITQLNYQKEAEKFRQTRDDETKTIKQRIQANEQLGGTLKNQLRDELAIAQLSLKVANARIQQTGKTKDSLDKQAEVLTEIADIQERITGQESEQLVNRNSLQKEAAEKSKATADAANAQSQKRIDVMKAEAAQSNLSTAQQIDNLEKVFRLQSELNKKTLSGPDLQKSQLANRQELSSGILAISEAQINAEVEAQKKAFAENKTLDQEEFASEIESANTLAKAQILLLDKKLLTEKDFAAEVVKINDAKNESIKIANDAFTESEKVRKEAELANTRALEDVAHQIRLQDIADQGITENEIRQATAQENYDNELLQLNQNLADKKISYDLYTQQKTLADKKFASETSKNDKIIAAQKKALNGQMLNDGVSALNSLFGESKAVAVASALINTYLGITSALAAPFPASIPAVAAAAATGFAAVKNILSSNKGSGSPDTSVSKVTTSGSGSFVNSAQTETIAKVSDKPAQDNTIVTPPVLVLETLLEAQNLHHIKITSP